MKLVTILALWLTCLPGMVEKAIAQPSTTTTTTTTTITTTTPPAETSPTTSDNLFHNKFRPIEGAKGVPLVGDSGYASIKYEIGTEQNRNQIVAIIEYLSKVLPGHFGNSAGTYTLTLTVTDGSGKVLAREPILSFQWTRERVLWIFDKVVENVRRSRWNGTLLDNVNVSRDFSRVNVAVEAYFTESRALDFDILKNMASALSTGSIASLVPLPAAATPVLEIVSNLANSLYANSKKETVVDEYEVPLNGSEPSVESNFRIGGYIIPVHVTIDVIESRIAGRLPEGKFKTKPDDAIFQNTTSPLGNRVRFVELITTADDSMLKGTRAMLDPVMSGGTYEKDNVGPLCGDLYAGLLRYMSIYDARAMFWAFLKHYGGRLNAAACLGDRQRLLTAVGLD